MRTIDELLATPLTTAKQAERWVYDVHMIGYGTHPDDPGDQIVDAGTGEATFTADQARLYDARMGEASTLLEDIYTVACAALDAYLGEG